MAHGGAGVGITFALDMQSPRTVRTCHSVGTTRSREAGWAMVLLLKILHLFQPSKSFLILVLKQGSVFRQDGLLVTEGHMCISHRCCFAHQLSKGDLCQSGLVQVFGGCIHQCQKKFLEQPYTHFYSIRPWCMWLCWKSFRVVQSLECMQVVRWWTAISAQIAFGFMWNVSIHS